MALGLSACGGAPPVTSAPLSRIEASALTLGPPRQVCAAERTVWVGHARGLVQWHIPAPAVSAAKPSKGGAYRVAPPKVEAATPDGVPGAPVWVGKWLLPISAPGLATLRCDAERVVVSTADGARHYATPEGLSPAPPLPPGATLSDGLVEGVGRDQPAPIGLAPGAIADGPAGQDESAQVAAWGFGVQRGGAWIFWRRAPGEVGDAAFDGQHLWLAAASGLWRFAPGQGEPQSVALPQAVSDQPLVRAFFDGEFIWVGTGDGHGHPLRVRGQAARTMPRDGQLNPEDAGLLAPLGPWLARGLRGAPGLSVNGTSLGGIEAGPLQALLPVGKSHLLVATETEVVLVRAEVSESAPATVVARWRQPGVLRLFGVGGHVLAVTRNDGVFRLDLR